MAYEIIDSCINCWACKPLCPSQAIYEARPHFRIDAAACSECEGDYADAQCVSVCPIEGAILDPFGKAANPPGSLNGIPPELMAEILAEIQAR